MAKTNQAAPKIMKAMSMVSGVNIGEAALCVQRRWH